MAWSCAQIEERLGEYLDGLLGEDERREFAAHAADCSRCRPLVERVSGVVRHVRALEPMEVPPQLISQILDQTLGPRATKQAGWFGWLQPVWQPRFALGAVTVAITFSFVFHAMGISPSKIKGADLTPASLYRSANRHVHLVYARGAKFVNDLRVVYEIQSRLRPEAAPAPAPEEQNTTPQSGPQQKSERDNKPGRSAIRNVTLLANVLTELPGRSLR